MCYNPIWLRIGLYIIFGWKLEFLSSDVMHGEGNLLTHLVILGYKLSHQQVSYSFHMLC